MAQQEQQQQQQQQQLPQSPSGRASAQGHGRTQSASSAGVGAGGSPSRPARHQRQASAAGTASAGMVTYGSPSKSRGIAGSETREPASSSSGFASTSASASTSTSASGFAGPTSPRSAGLPPAHHSRSNSAGTSQSQSTLHARARGSLGTAGRPPHHRQALSAIRAFLRRESCFDILPESFRMIVFDNKLNIRRALVALQTNGVVSAPLYDSSNYRFAGMFTLVDVIHLIQFYYLTATGYDSAAVEVESVDLHMLREIEVAIDVPPPPIISVHPDDQLYTACAALVRTHARRLPLIDRDAQTGKETIVSVLTQYRVLKFLAINCRQECSKLTESIGTLGIGTYLSSFSPTGEALDGASGSKDGQEGGPAATPQPSRRQRSRSFLPHSRTGASTPTHPGLGGGGSSAGNPTSARAEEGLPLEWDETLAPGMSIPENGLPSSSAYPASSSAIDDAELGESSTPQVHHLPSAHSGSNASSAPPPDSPQISDRFHPLATATLQTTVFDVVHLFSDLGISAVPIVDPETGQVINLYEAVDVVDLVRSNAYRDLEITIEDALARRGRDFPGVVTCTPEDSLASIMAYIREKRVHRFVIVEGDEQSPELGSEEEQPAADTPPRPKKVPGRLVGLLCLSDLLKYFVGSGSLSGVKVVGLGFRSEEEGLAIPRVVDDEELDELNEGVSGLGIEP